MSLSILIRNRYYGPETFTWEVGGFVCSAVSKALGKSRTKIGGFEVIGSSETQDLISSHIESGDPFLVGRVGTTEGEAIRWRQIHPEKSFPSSIRRNLSRLSGIFGHSNAVLNSVIDLQIQAIQETDVMSIRTGSSDSRYWKMESKVLEIGTQAKVTDISNLSPFKLDNQWVQALAKKKVLVIHPFAESIRSQYERRDSLFVSPSWMPDFEIQCAIPPQTLGFVDGNSSWTSLMEGFMERIKGLDFEIALIGAGGFGLPIGAALKKHGKKAIVVGGALQLFFGIRGGRWDKEAEILGLDKYWSDSWVRPLAIETITNSSDIEGGAYW